MLSISWQEADSFTLMLLWFLSLGCFVTCEVALAGARRGHQTFFICVASMMLVSLVSLRPGPAFLTIQESAWHCLPAWQYKIWTYLYWFCVFHIVTEAIPRKGWNDKAGNGFHHR